MTNKAHTAAVNRILNRYQGTFANDGLFDIIAGDMLIAVETSKTLAAAFTQIHAHGGTRYIAVTNQETLEQAQRLAEGTTVGVMNSHGDIVKPAE